MNVSESGERRLSREARTVGQPHGAEGSAYWCCPSVSVHSSLPNRTDMRRFFVAASFLAVLSTNAEGQGLRDKISQLFIFGGGADPLFLAGSADPNNPASIRAHGEHFVPAAVS